MILDDRAQQTITDMIEEGYSFVMTNDVLVHKGGALGETKRWCALFGKQNQMYLYADCGIAYDPSIAVIRAAEKAALPLGT